MGKNNKVDQASAQIPDTIDTPEEMVIVGKKYVGAIKASANWANATEVQLSTNGWATETTNLETANADVEAKRKALEVALTTQRGTVRRWRGRLRGTMDAITYFSDGSKDQIGTFAVGVFERVASPLETMPEGLRKVASKTSHTASVRWGTHAANHGYMVQTATNSADATTYATPVNCSKGTFSLPGQTLGATVYFRVAAVDARLPGGQTAYTAWVAVVIGN